MDPTAKRTVAGRYRLTDRLGAGSMGTVWRAEDLSLGREVAVKEVVFPPGVSEQQREILRERTRREARMAAGLAHPNAVTVYDVAEEDGTTFVVMELVPSRTLADVIRTDGPLTPARTAEVGLGVLGALTAAHARGIVHRDVKPGNVLVRDDGRVVLTDFGISTSTSDPSLTTTGVLVGSPAYMSPERARGEVPGPASDLWSLGATLFAAVEGRPPFDRGEALPTLSAVLTEPHAPFTAAGPLAPVLNGLLEKDPALRLDAAGARRALTSLAASATEAAPGGSAAAVPTVVASSDLVAGRTAAVPLRDVQAEVRSGRRSKAPLVLVGVVFVGAVGAGIAALSQGGGTDPRPTTELPPAAAGGSSDGRPGIAAAGPSAASSAAPRTSAAAPHPSAPTPSGSPASASSGSSASASSGSSGGTASAAGVPAGWTTYRADQGWSVAHPPGWSVSSYSGGQIQLKDGATGRTLRVDTTSSPKSDPVADWRSQAKSFARRHHDYAEIRIAKVAYRNYNAADWEFTYSGLHVVNRGFVVSPQRAYALYWQTRGSDWDAARTTFDQIAASFQPA